MTELPERSSALSSFTTASLSPVSRDSLTSSAPEMMTASLQIWLPLSRTIRSSFTISSRPIFLSSPSLRTITDERFRMDSSSTSFFAFSSCTIPITIFRMMIAINSMFEYAPTAKRSAAIRKFRKLKSVKTFSRTIWDFVFVICSAVFPPSPFSRRSSTSGVDNPDKDSFILFLPPDHRADAAGNILSASAFSPKG